MWRKRQWNREAAGPGAARRRANARAILAGMRPILLVLLFVAAATAVLGCRGGQQGAAPNAAPVAPAISSTPGGAAPTAGTIAPAPLAGDVTRLLSSGGRERTYVLHVPAGLDGGARPLVVVFHGGGGNAQNAMAMTGFNTVADREGFVVAYANGTGRAKDVLLTFNAGNCCGYALEQKVDDVAYTRAMVAAIEGELPIDRKRVYVTGMSNGGMMAYRLACEMADVFAAAAPVAGALNVPCAPAQPISLVAYHGTADRNVQYDGGPPGASIDLAHPRTDAPVAQSLGAFVSANGCPEEAQTTTRGHIRTEVRAPCRSGTAVTLYTVVGGGHAWPGGPRLRGLADTPTTELSATETMWAFFKTHPRP